MISLVVGASIGALGSLETSARDEVANQEDCVASRPPPPSCQIGVVTTSTTLVPPETTTTTVGTPIPPPSGAYENSRSEASPPTWSAITDIVLTADGQPVAGILVRYRARLVTPPGPTFYVSCTTDAAGRCELRFQVPDTGSLVDKVDFTPDLISTDPPPETLPPILEFNRP